MVLGASPDSMAPAYKLTVNRQDVGIGITDLVDQVSYESADGIADVLRIQCANPDGKISDSKIFQIGNRIHLWMGYGANLVFIGGAVINKVRTMFPSGRIPTLQVTAYTRDHQLMDNAPPEAKKRKRPKKKKKGQGGRIFKDTIYANAIIDRAKDYNMYPDVDDTGEQPHDFIQKAGMNDFEFINGLANLTGFAWWVEGDEVGDDILRFKDPANLSEFQEKQRTFRYNTELATLLSFEPEENFQGSYNRLVAHVKNARTGKLLQAEVVDGAIVQDDLTYKVAKPGEDIIEPPPSGGAIKLFFGDFSVDVVTTKKFENEGELARFAARWFEQNRDNFVLARGRTIGVEDLKARQVHTIEGCGARYDGDYQFTRVNHIMTADGGYICDFNARKLLPPA